MKSTGCLFLLSSALVGCTGFGQPDPSTLVVPPKTASDFVRMAKAIAKHGDLFDQPFIESVLRTTFTGTESYHDFPDGRRVVAGHCYKAAADFWYPNPYGNCLYDTRLGGVGNSRSGKCLQDSPEGVCLAGFSAGIHLNALPLYFPNLCISVNSIKAELGAPDFKYITPHSGRVWEYDYVRSNYVSGISFGGIFGESDTDCFFSIYVFERQRERVDPSKPAAWS